MAQLVRQVSLALLAASDEEEEEEEARVVALLLPSAADAADRKASRGKQRLSERCLLLLLRVGPSAILTLRVGPSAILTSL